MPGQSYDFNFPLLPEDYVFKAGHQLGVVVVGSYSQLLERRRPDPGEHHAERP